MCRRREGLRYAVCRLFVSRSLTHSPETSFEDGPQGTSNHSLLCACEPDVSILWFITPSKEAEDVAHHLSTFEGAPMPRSLSLTELSGAPFTVYICAQKRGDLVVLPPRRFVREGISTLQLRSLIGQCSYHQSRFRGIAASMS